MLDSISDNAGETMSFILLRFESSLADLLDSLSAAAIASRKLRCCSVFITEQHENISFETFFFIFSESYGCISFFET